MFYLFHSWFEKGLVLFVNVAGEFKTRDLNVWILKKKIKGVCELEKKLVVIRNSRLCYIWFFFFKYHYKKVLMPPSNNDLLKRYVHVAFANIFRFYDCVKYFLWNHETRLSEIDCENHVLRKLYWVKYIQRNSIEWTIFKDTIRGTFSEKTRLQKIFSKRTSIARYIFLKNSISRIIFWKN